ncbi:MAG: hypothetical protein KC434_08115, partial [Anaerolineales bacterium]|nr:hypothetical protein [Anaerolineales bacterium]
DHTQSFVFQSPRLTEIRGASMRLDRLNEALPQMLHDEWGLPADSILEKSPGCIVYNGGGGMMALVPLALAPEICAAIEAFYPQQTDTATITAVFQPITPADVQGLPQKIAADGLRQQLKALPKEQQVRVCASYEVSTVGELSQTAVDQVQGIPRIMRQQMALLQQRKQSKPFKPLVEASPFARRCNSCGRRPSGHFQQIDETEEVSFLCSVCYQNHKDGIGGRRYWQDAFKAWYGQEVEVFYNDYLSDIGTDSEKPRYVGYIYTDGNKIGRLLESSTSLPQFAELSRKLSQAMRTAVFQALANHIVKNGRALRFEIITIGGDDAILIVPAHVAVPVAQDLCRIFAQELQNLNEDPPGMSAGVVLAQESNPIYFLNDLAKQLLKNAKRGSHLSNKAEPSLDFMVLKSQSTVAVDLKDVRRSPYFQVSLADDERCYLTGRPYSLAQAAQLWQDAQKVSQVRLSNGQLHQMRRAFQQGRFPAIFHYLYQTARFNSAHRQLFADIEQDWALAEVAEPNAQAAGASPWRVLPTGPDGSQQYDTPILDLLELREFVPGEATSQEANDED